MTATQMIFDTNCILCSGFVKFILRHERGADIVFVNAWSETGTALAGDYGLTPEDLNKTFLVIKSGQGYVKSSAGFLVLQHLKAPWRWLRILKIVPRPLRDGAYTFVAKRRYRWFGFEESCLIPKPDQAYRFIDL